MEQARGTNTGIPYHVTRIRTHPARESPTCSFLLRRDRVNVPTRPAERTPQVTDSEPRLAARECPERAERRTAGSAPLRGDPEAGAHAPERSEGGTPQAVRFAVGADCCGAIGCHETDGLLVVEQGGETRTLCPDHARRWSG